MVSDPVTVLADGTVKQRNPFTGTEVWTVPGRASRPFGQSLAGEQPVDDSNRDSCCAFCASRLRETPPEKARLVRTDGGLQLLRELSAAQLDDTVAEFRVVPNLFEILPLAYWRANHGWQPSAQAVARRDSYLADTEGRSHLETVAASWARASGLGELSEQRLRDVALGWFASMHQLVIPRRHFVDDATSSTQLCSSGELAVDEHRAYIELSIASMRELYEQNSSARYVSVFQNWLRPAGASFEHLHKQVVAIDEYGPHVTDLAAALARNPRANDELALDLAVDQKLLLAANDHAIAWVGIGHRYPAVEVWSRHPGRPWELDPEQVAGVSDLVHAVHAAAGAQVSCNEEWMHRPPDCDQEIRWRVLVKWRISTLAGFEGATRVYLNTLSPWAMRERLLPRLVELREQGRLAPMQLGDEVSVRRGAMSAGH